MSPPPRTERILSSAASPNPDNARLECSGTWFPANPHGMGEPARPTAPRIGKRPLLAHAMKVLLVDDHALFRAGLRLLLSTIAADMQVLEAATVEQAETLALEHPDLQLCLLDLMLKDEHGLQALQRIKAAAPGVAAVVVSASTDAASVRASLDAGAMSYIPKSMPPEQLTHAMRQVLEGRIYLPEEVMRAELAMPAPATLALSPRQLDVLGGLSRGLPTKLIARELQLSEHTVKEYIAALFQVLGVHNRTEAVIKASRLGIASRFAVPAP